MLDRCQRPANRHYADYGGRGITVCERWKQFDAFFEDMGEAPADLTLERLNNNEGYNPDNCVWATRKEQARNKRNTVRITHNGRTMALADWADEIGLPSMKIWRRLKRGWSTPEALYGKGATDA